MTPIIKLLPPGGRELYFGNILTEPPTPPRRGAKKLFIESVTYLINENKSPSGGLGGETLESFYAVASFISEI